MKEYSKYLVYWAACQELEWLEVSKWSTEKRLEDWRSTNPMRSKYSQDRKASTIALCEADLAKVTGQFNRAQSAVKLMWAALDCNDATYRLNLLWDVFKYRPNLRATAYANALCWSPKTVRKYAAELEAEGILEVKWFFMGNFTASVLMEKDSSEAAIKKAGLHGSDVWGFHWRNFKESVE